jgi:hypothetical protein
MNRPTALWALSTLPVSLGLLACDVPWAPAGAVDAAAATPSLAASAAPAAAAAVAAAAASAPVRSIYSIVPDWHRSKEPE